MAHQTGIEASDALKTLISKALKGSLRFFQVKIENEELVPGEFGKPQHSWEIDLDVMVQPTLEEKCPCYIFYRLDTYNVQSNYLWVFMSYTPDFSPVKQKMLYAATKATVRKAFDSSAIVDDLAATSKEELTLAGYRLFEESKNAAPPLTEAELELMKIHENEDHTDLGKGSSHLHGVAFPVQPQALTALQKFKHKQVTYVGMSIDAKKEVINLEAAKNEIDANSLSGLVPEETPRYHLFCFKHTHEGDYQEAVVFIYSCPGFKSSVKERMLYSSCKESLVCALEEELKKPIDKKIEISSGSDLSEEFIMEEVHPKKTIVRQKFLKPKGPNRRPKSPTSRPVDNGNGD